MPHQTLEHWLRLDRAAKLVGIVHRPVTAEQMGLARLRAPTESSWGRLKVGRLYGKRFTTRRTAMDEMIDWLMFYNHSRLHSSLGYMSPVQFEQRWLAEQRKKLAYLTTLWTRLNEGKVRFDNREKGMELWKLARHYQHTDTTFVLLWLDGDDLPEVEIDRFGVRPEDDCGLTKLTGELPWTGNRIRR